MRKFKDLQVGEKFEVYGDIHLNYVYPVICVCEKVDDNTGQELNENWKDGRGIKFSMSENDEVFDHNPNMKKFDY